MANITYVKHVDIDKAKWDTCIDHASNALIYAYSYYLDLMSKNWDALVMNDYEAVMPLTWNRKFGISYLRQPAFTQQLGVFGNGSFGNSLTEKFVNKAVDLFSFAEINLNFANEYDKCAATKCNLILHLNQPFTVIEKSFKKNFVKKAKGAHLIYEPSGEIEEAIKLCIQIYSKRIPNLTEKNFKDLEQLCILLQNRGQLLIRKVSSRKENCWQYLYFLKIPEEFITSCQSHCPVEYTYDANHFLLHELIKEFSEQNFIFDFEGSEIPSINFFFRKFNPVEQPYYFVRINKLKFWKRWIKKMYDYYKYAPLKDK